MTDTGTTLTKRDYSQNNSMYWTKLKETYPEQSDMTENMEQFMHEPSGEEVRLTNQQCDNLNAIMQRAFGSSAALSNRDVAQMNAAGFESLYSQVQLNQQHLEEQMQGLGRLIALAHSDTIAQLQTLQNNMALIEGNVVTVGNAVNSLSRDLAALQHDFQEYAERGVRANESQRAETRLVRLNQQLEQQFGQNKELRRTAVGILEATSLEAIRPETILNKAEELCLSTPRYWLAPALVALANWVKWSQGGDSRESRQAIHNMLNEAYKRDRQKTALFFGLIFRRAGNTELSNQWFQKYLGFQEDKMNVDRTCIMLLNVYSSGIMGHGKEEDEMRETIKDWLEKLFADKSNKLEQEVINSWSLKTAELVEANDVSFARFQGLQQFCPQTWPTLERCLRSSYAHREMGNYLNREYALRDFGEDDETLIDDMITTLVTDFDVDELPIRRQLETEKLVIDLQGRRNMAEELAKYKNEALSQTRSLASLISDAAMNSELSGASIQTHVFALEVLKSQISTGYETYVDWYRSLLPKSVEIEMGDFRASTEYGSDEDQLVDSFVKFVDDQERTQLEAARASTAVKALTIGGAIAAVLGLILSLAGGGFLGALLLMAGVAALICGLASANTAKKKQAKVIEECKAKREKGTLVLREVCKEARDYKAAYENNESLHGMVRGIFEEEHNPSDVAKVYSENNQTAR